MPRNFYIKVRARPTSLSIDSNHHSQGRSNFAITYFRTLDEQVNRSLNTERMLAALSGAFGTLALLLSLVGLYGVMSFVVTQRRREIGIRIALAQPEALPSGWCGKPFAMIWPAPPSRCRASRRWDGWWSAVVSD